MDNDEDFRDVQSRGLGVETRELTVAGQIPISYLDIECRDPSGHSALDLIGGEIVDGLTNTDQEPSDIVRKALAKWRRFWGQVPTLTLTREEQIGLFAELWFILTWLIPRFGVDSILPWRGPWGSRHDFEWGDKSVEVKATTSSRGQIFHIHGLRQLEPPANGPLYLFGMSLHEEAGSTNNLPGLVELIRNQISIDFDTLTVFENSLIQAGYSPVYEDVYSKLSLRIIEELLFVVRDDFPRITRANFLEGFPDGVEEIEYTINLNGFKKLVSASCPEESPF